MDALEFLRERKRLCNSYGHCEGCLLEEVSCALEQTDSDGDYGIVIATVEQWSKEHPRKTRQNVFLKQYPEAEIDKCGYLMLCPKFISADWRNKCGNCTSRVCSDCRHEFWVKEVE